MTIQPLLDVLSDALGNAFEQAGFPRERGKAVVSQRPDLAQFQCNGAMALAKEFKQNPLQIAEAIAVVMQGNPLFLRVEVAKPGFLNFDVADNVLAAHAKAMAEDAFLGGYRVDAPQKVLIDYCGPNVAKSMHVGHLRTSIIGNSLYRLFKQVGHEVLSDIHLGDWGLQMGMLISELEIKHPEWPYFDENQQDFPKTSPVTLADLEAIYPPVAAECKTNPARLEKARQATQALQEGHKGYLALWHHFIDVSLKQVKENLTLLDIDFDYWYGESSVQNRIEPMVKRLKAEGITHQDAGAWIISVAEEADSKEIPPLILVKSDGAALYSTTDLATIEQRVEDFAPDKMLYVVDQRQHLHFEQVFRAAKKAGYLAKAECEHIGFGTVNGKDGKPFKTREGGVMRLRDLIDMAVEAVRAKNKDVDEEMAKTIGISALKFADLSSNRLGGYSFDPEKFVSFEGKTGPYLQYACVRIKSMLEKAEVEAGEINLSTPEERQLVLAIARLPLAMKDALELREPYIISEFAYELAQSFSRFYAACPIAKAESPAVAASRLALSGLVLRVLELSLGLLGIRVPERM